MESNFILGDEFLEGENDEESEDLFWWLNI